MGFIDVLKRVKNLFIRFWRSENNKISLIRDVLIAFFLVLIIMLALWAYTGQWFATPMVAIESGSMTHPDEPFGRLGTIDAGDMVLLVKVDSIDDIVPRGSNIHGALAEKNSDHFYYQDYGDVIIYKPNGNSNTHQIIHRAICWVEYDDESKTYTVEDYGINNSTSITIKELGLNNYKPPNPHSGFITKGDNNDWCDQTSPNICLNLIRVEWISGKARCELPWVGTINLLFNDIFTSGEDMLPYVQSDSIICLFLLIGLLLSIPIILDLYSHYKQKKAKNLKDNSMEKQEPEKNSNEESFEKK